MTIRTCIGPPSLLFLPSPRDARFRSNELKAGKSRSVGNVKCRAEAISAAVVPAAPAYAMESAMDTLAGENTRLAFSAAIL